MILGVDHLQLTATDTRTAYTPRGVWGVTFAAHGLPNPPEKREFLHEYHPTHDIVYMEKPGELAVEVVAQGPSPHKGNCASYLPLGNRCVRVMVDDVAASLMWWSFLFDFEPTEGWVGLRSRMGRNIALEVQNVRGAPTRRYLDGTGWPCLALLTNDIGADLERARHGARRWSPVFPFTVNGKDLRICILAGPNGELVELIEVQR